MCNYHILTYYHHTRKAKSDCAPTWKPWTKLLQPLRWSTNSWPRCSAKEPCCPGQSERSDLVTISLLHPRIWRSSLRSLMRPNHPRTNKTKRRIVTGRIVTTNVTPRMLSINIYNASRIATSSLAILHVIICHHHSFPFPSRAAIIPSKRKSPNPQKNKSALPQLSPPPHKKKKNKQTSFPQKNNLHPFPQQFPQQFPSNNPGIAGRQHRASHHRVAPAPPAPQLPHRFEGPTPAATAGARGGAVGHETWGPGGAERDPGRTMGNGELIWFIPTKIWGLLREQCGLYIYIYNYIYIYMLLWWQWCSF